MYTTATLALTRVPDMGHAETGGVWEHALAWQCENMRISSRNQCPVLVNVYVSMYTARSPLSEERSSSGRCCEDRQLVVRGA